MAATSSSAITASSGPDPTTIRARIGHFCGTGAGAGPATMSPRTTGFLWSVNRHFNRTHISSHGNGRRSHADTSRTVRSPSGRAWLFQNCVTRVHSGPIGPAGQGPEQVVADGLEPRRGVFVSFRTKSRTAATWPASASARCAEAASTPSPVIRTGYPRPGHQGVDPDDCRLHDAVPGVPIFLNTAVKPRTLLSTPNPHSSAPR